MLVQAVNPKRAIDYIAQQAKAEGIPEKHLEYMVCSFYRELKSKMSNLEHFRIMVPGIGYMATNRKAVNRQMDKLQLRLDKKNGRCPMTHEDHEQLQLRIQNVLLWEQFLKREAKVRELIKIFKQQNRDELEGNTAAGMEEQGTDS